MAFAVDGLVKVRELPTCTGVKAYWKVPGGVKGVEPRPACKVDFSSAKSRKNATDKFLADASATTQVPKQQKALRPVSAPTDDELNQFFQSLSVSGKPNILKNAPGFYQHYLAKPAGLPPSLHSHFNPECANMTLEELQVYCKEKVNIDVTKEQCDLLEQKTRAQAKSSHWFDARAGRVTASRLHAVCHTNIEAPAPSLLQNICYPQKTTFTSLATHWGQINESIAKKAYSTSSSKQHKDLTIRSCGIYVHPDYPFMGASPDAVVSCECHGEGVVEIKCPYSHRYHSVEQALEDRHFCLQKEDGKIVLSRQHPYYSQVQGQIFLAGVSYCDFVV